jgi:hypothetical protein
MRRRIGNSRDNPLHVPAIFFVSGHTLNNLDVHFDGGGLGQHFH